MRASRTSPPSALAFAVGLAREERRAALLLASPADHPGVERHALRGVRGAQHLPAEVRALGTGVFGIARGAAQQIEDGSLRILDYVEAADVGDVHARLHHLAA